VNEKNGTLTHIKMFAEAMNARTYESGQAHFALAGFREGRTPHANFQFLICA
jgi:hypothetical protein